MSVKERERCGSCKYWERDENDDEDCYYDIEKKPRKAGDLACCRFKYYFTEKTATGHRKRITEANI